MNRDGMSDFRNILTAQEQFFKSGQTHDLDYRLDNLKRLKNAIIQNESAFMEALKKDLSRAPYESYLLEVGVLLAEIRLVKRRLKSWARPRRAKTPFLLWFASSRIYCEPYGRVLIIAPWNYPFLLSISPLIGSIAAGNCTVLKPSEYAPHTAAVISEMMASCFDKRYIAVIEGDARIGEALLEEHFDYIFFTGSVNVGKRVMSAAAKNLTPLTLELGGKNPCIIDQDVNLDVAARRIVFGKFINAGQTCIAPDYLWVHQSNKSKLLERIRNYLNRFYGEDPRKSPDFARIINQQHFNRLCRLLEKGDVIIGGQNDPQDLYIAPTVLTSLSWDDPVMQDEIFGPILPVLEFEDLSHVISSINSRPKPLALYIFSSRQENCRKVVDQVSFGNGCINETVVQFANPNLPFGGVGSSGMGGYHGKASFDILSHKKSILKKSFILDPPLRYPPYKNKLSVLKKILR
ncbi:MAG: aldehyde dehydrogenase [Deltaproteobacteria bacterium]|jgi:aldehyde dehydrogenase (NAD+)